ncbi:MAG TPA: GtrA family protein [Terriglobales bacterium]|nr:GtrA family protein [Terriglobales bacterium]
MKVVIRAGGWFALLQRWIKFHMVGLVGMCVQLTILPLLKSGLGLEYMPATVLAVEAAVLHNFAWHEKFTWRDRASVHYSEVVKRLLRFNLTTGMISIVGNILIMRFLVGQEHMAYMMANVIAIGCCSIANFLCSEVIVFRKVATP